MLRVGAWRVGARPGEAGHAVLESTFSRPAGTGYLDGCLPTAEAVGYYRTPLRGGSGKDFGLIESSGSSHTGARAHRAIQDLSQR